MKKLIEIETTEERAYEPVTFKDLLESMNNEMDVYEKIGLLDELMEQEIMLDITDYRGNILLADVSMPIGFVEGGGFVLAGNLSKVIEQ
jgi:hypothetical protein